MLLHKTRAVDYLRRYGLDALIATSPVNITYVTDYTCWLDPLFKEYMARPGASSHLAQNYALLPLEGEPALVVNPLMAINAADSWVKDLYLYGNSGLDYSLTPPNLPADPQRLSTRLQASPTRATPTAALLSSLHDRRLSNAVIGVEMEGLPAAVKAELAAALPHATLRDCTNLIRLIRMVKSAEELARLTRAAAIGEVAAAASLALAQSGRPIANLVQMFRQEVARQGAAFDHFAYSVRGMGIATEPHYRLTTDDLLYVDFGCIYQGYFSDAGVTLALGEPAPALQQRYTALADCLAAGQALLRPGTNASAVQAAMQETLAGHGITAAYPHGHGLGLDLRDYPILAPANGLRIRDECIDESSDLPLESEMVLNLEAGLFLPGVGSLQIEQSFVVTPAGNRPLTPQVRGLSV
jgi:Xaa-Pro aminopeptidase